MSDVPNKKKYMNLLHASIPSFRELCDGFLHLLYPELCVACGEAMPPRDSCFCFRCQLKVSVSDMCRQKENEFTARFLGRMPVQSAAAMYYFSRKSPVQQALHRLKYHNQPEIGLKIGRAFGRRLKESGTFGDVQVIVPVPLHPRKERLRGYNQSAQFARGLSEVMDIPVLDKVLLRPMFTETQTRKKRMERFENVESVFALKKPASIEGRHILLVDDVLTTGATLEECGQLLLRVSGTRLSLATMAMAINH